MRTILDESDAGNTIAGFVLHAIYFGSLQSAAETYPRFADGSSDECVEAGSGQSFPHVLDDYFHAIRMIHGNQTQRALSAAVGVDERKRLAASVHGGGGKPFLGLRRKPGAMGDVRNNRADRGDQAVVIVNDKFYASGVSGHFD